MSSRPWAATIVAGLIGIAATAAPVLAQNRPFWTEPASTVPKKNIRFEAGFEFFQDVTLTLPGLKGDLSSIGVLGLRSGVGEQVELQLFWTVQNFFNIDERFPAPNSDKLDFSGNSTNSIGDLFIGAKWRFLEEKGSRPAIGLHFMTQLPNASDETGLGNDVLNFFNTFLVEKHFSDTRVVLNLGLAILSDPLDASSQDDLLLYGLSVLHPVSDNVSLLADYYGRAGPGGIGTEEQMRLRLGGQIRTGKVYWDVAFMFGMRDTDPKTGILVGLSYDFSF